MSWLIKEPLEMPRYLLVILFIGFSLSPPPLVRANDPNEGVLPFLTARIADDMVIVRIGDNLFTCYKFGTSLKKPYFWPVNGPVSAKSVTVESTEPYPHHNSLFFGCDMVNGANYWQEGNERGQIISQGPEIIESNGQRIIFIDHCLWKQPDTEPVLKDFRRISISAPCKTLRFIDFEITLTPCVDIRIMRTNHSLFSVRVAPQLSVNNGGTLVNAQGGKGEKGTWGVESGWCDYFGMRDGVTEGIAILQHPGNKWFPSKWFTRDYGFFSPTPMYWPQNGIHTDLAKDVPLTLRYRVVVHAQDTESADIGGIFEQYKSCFMDCEAVPGQVDKSLDGSVVND